MVLISLTTNWRPSERKSMRATPRTPGERGHRSAARLAELLLQLGRDLGRQLTVGAGHALAGHVLVPVVEDVGCARGPDGPLDGRELELGPAAHGHLQVGQVGPVGLDHGPEPEMGIGAGAGPGRWPTSSTTSMPMDDPPKRGLTM